MSGLYGLHLCHDEYNKPLCYEGSAMSGCMVYACTVMNDDLNVLQCPDCMFMPVP